MKAIIRGSLKVEKDGILIGSLSEGLYLARFSSGDDYLFLVTDRKSAVATYGDEAVIEYAPEESIHPLEFRRVRITTLEAEEIS